MADSADKPDAILVPNDRVFERTQGCWNCRWSQRATAFWTERRQWDLNKALTISMTSPLGEEDPKVQNIKNMVNKVDHGVASGSLLRCVSIPKGRSANGDPVGDLVVHNYLCDRWSGATGASVARGGQKPDTLPEELADKIDGSGN